MPPCSGFAPVSASPASSQRTRSRSAVVAFAVLAVLLSGVTAAQATSVSVGTSARGAYRGDTGAMWTGGSGTATGNFLTGLVAPGLESRGYLVFDLTAVTSTIQSATLVIQLSALANAVAVGQAGGSEVVSLFDVASDLAAARSARSSTT